MKNYILLLFVMMLSLFSFSQNLDFENWNADTILYLENYHTTINDNAEFGQNTVIRSIDFVDGVYSVKLTTVLTINNDTLFGYFANGNPDSLSGGVPTPLNSIDSVIGYYKCNIQVGDSALILCQAKYNGALSGIGVHKFNGTQSTWKRFSFPVSASSVDSVIIAGASSNVMSGVGVTPGSYILFDNIHLKSNSVGLDTIPNFSFENWSNYIWEDLDEWTTPNEYFVGFSSMPVEKTNDYYSGNYASLLKTQLTFWGDTVSGFMSYGQWSINGPVGGFAFSGQPDSVEFYYKLTLSGVDTATAYIVFKKMGIPIASNGEKLSLGKLSYTRWIQPVNLSQVPDTVFMAFSSGENPGSQFIIDKINFIFPVAIKDNYNLRRVVAYPNPTLNSLHFRISSKGNNDVMIGLYSVDGKLVLSKEYKNISGNNDLILDISTLKQGNYIYKIKVGNDVYSKTIVKK